jgi:farnesyl diphosphate synthase
MDAAASGGAFDDKLGRLEKIVVELEQGGLGLEPAIERYQEGIQLLKECHRALERYSGASRSSRARPRARCGPSRATRTSRERRRARARAAQARDGRRWLAEAALERAAARARLPARTSARAAARGHALRAARRRQAPAPRARAPRVPGARRRGARRRAPASRSSSCTPTASCTTTCRRWTTTTLRRGRPTVHVAFDEATAILVGDALPHARLSRCSPRTTRRRLSANTRGSWRARRCSRGWWAVTVLDPVAGRPAGRGETKRDGRTLAALEDMHRRKTAAQFRRPGVRDGRARRRARGRGRALCGLRRAPRAPVPGRRRLARRHPATRQTWARTPGKDAALSRPTLVRALGLEGTRRRAEELARAARGAARELGSAPEPRSTNSRTSSWRAKRERGV